MNRTLTLSLAAFAWSLATVAAAQQSGQLPVVHDVEVQPLQAQANRVAEALDSLGAPLTEAQQQKLDAALAETDPAKSILQIQQLFDPLCLVGVNINPESRVKVAAGPAPKQLLQQGWRVFLVKVHNEAGVTAALRASSPNAAPVYTRSTSSPDPEPTVQPSDLPHRWLDVSMFDRQPLMPTLSGLPLEYRIIELYSRDEGRREAKLMFDVGQGTQDLGFRNEVNILFDGQKAVQVVLEVLDVDGTPTTGQFVFRDGRGRVYPSRSRRLAPDFFFHDQIYRHSGEHVLLPAGDYQVTFTRGPEYNIEQRNISVPEGETHREKFQLSRWIKLADLDWYSGDHHVHAAGCAHYESPTEGVMPEHMMRHILGEDLNVGCVLSWGPCWYFQKDFFSGQVHELSTDKYLMRYDVEVSGFPSSHAGHLTLLRLTEDDYPGATQIEQWPSWDLPVLQWGKEQGAVVGFSHSGWGLQVDATSLPTYDMPPFDGIGANEYIVDVAHDACDFISTVDTPSVWELNIWYHTLNCGFTARISGETDFPCIYGERVGLGRSYVKLPGTEELDFDAWVNGIRDGRSYVSDGLSHLVDYQVNGLGVGEPGEEGRPSELAVAKGGSLTITARAAAMLEESPRNDIRRRGLHEKPYWHVERARIGNSRQVPVELIVNGESVERKVIEGDGSLQDITFDYVPDKSCWVALRIFPSSHTNPVFVQVDGEPIRASRRSAQWCLEAVDVCWRQKSPRIRASEKEAAAAAYEKARQVYRQILAECETP
ncbi:MAG: CehA/McbA family metallohydrolase [Pirellulales bacterium]